MADLRFTEDAELQKLNSLVKQDPEKFENWEQLVRAAEQQEGGLGRNSSPQAIAATRQVYDKFLARYPLFFGYWKKYADLEFAIAGTEAAEMVYERGVASIGTSVDLWANYCAFKTETSHEPEIILELFERGAESVGLDFLSHPFWDKYIEYAERIEKPEYIFPILSRIIHIPLHQYARYFERYRNMAANIPIADLASESVISVLRRSLSEEMGVNEASVPDQQLRAKLDAYHMEVFTKTQAETTKRWKYESEVKRPYYHVTELDEAQLENWRQYLDFEEAQGDYKRVKFLYERCLVTAANYEEFWLRYARWMIAEGWHLEVSNIYERASCLYVPISQPEVRLRWAIFEESIGRAQIAVEIYEAILTKLPHHTQTIIAMANLYARQNGVNDAITLLQGFVEDTSIPLDVRGEIISEWASKVWKQQGDAVGARAIYEKHYGAFVACEPFWHNWFSFELQLPSFGKMAPGNHNHIKKIFDLVRTYAKLPQPAIREIASNYLKYLEERGGSSAMEEALLIDTQMNGPISVQNHSGPWMIEDSMCRNRERDAEAQKLIGHPWSKFFPVDMASDD
ncbi:Hypothetical protein R9X50_00664100 [Acrodontium crateriforme]|uniref:Pre-mRNA-processing factor 39 n=1 Tax=Acrodontium crateriforme TaxID=150365 RepID=A0AAQ3MBB4_9PEZI|nr:Hypothetical protein R9X50_00664100 [Acrodontium crateriforme]